MSGAPCCSWRLPPCSSPASPTCGTSPSCRSGWVCARLSLAPPTPASCPRSPAHRGCSRPTPCRAWCPAAPSPSGPSWPACSWRPSARGGRSASTGSATSRARASLLRLRPPAFLGRPAAKPAPAGPAGGRAFFRDLADGWREFTSHTWIWVMVAGAALFLFAIDGPIQVLGPIVARDVYDGARTWGLTSAAMGIGQIAGGLLSLRWRPRRPMLVIAAGMSLTALPVAFLALEAPVWTLYASLAAVGVEWGLYDPFWLTCMQRDVAPSMISRVSAYDYLGVLAFYPAGLALAGPLADAFGRSTVLWAVSYTHLTLPTIYSV